MSVSAHLAIDLAEYDRKITTFIPHYTEMLTVAASVVPLARRTVKVVVDLGTGTGALAARIAAGAPAAAIVGIDEDPGMLANAARRLRRRRVSFVEGSFLSAPLPRCDAVTASFSLHHVKSRRRKGELYERVHAALRPGGIFVGADCQPASGPHLAAAGRRAWRDHLARRYGGRQAEGFLRAWSGEDFYMPLETELSLIRAAGLKPELIWRKESFAVIAAWR